MSINYNHNHYRDGFGFSIFLLICNILVRPFTTFVLLRIHNDRDLRQTLYGDAATTGSGIHNPNHDQFNVFGNRSGYQDLDSQRRQQQPDHQTSQQQQQQQKSNGPSSPSKTNTMPYQSIPDPFP
ncbi:Angiotensin II, type I receptor-associated protein-like protein [Euroglyphus maynei]|uniref:Angiotensin II, type I receptor-associated protein-like protein n=1 Tax=Euroglyphus maynei TaxID=6958 RepID=A0A1Y3ARD5_EURMA|nr:Angiotensin II, type I receptor-associated protein-like protein [Euroglyphus maynei]